jgi:hypothetical protein
VGGEVQLGPLGTAATNRPIVPAPGDYDDWQGKPKHWEKTCHQCRFDHQRPHMPARTRTRAAAVGSQRLTA